MISNTEMILACNRVLVEVGEVLKCNPKLVFQKDALRKHPDVGALIKALADLETEYIKYGDLSRRYHEEHSTPNNQQ